MPSFWCVLIALAAGAFFFPPLRAEYLRPETWLRPADEMAWYRPDEMEAINARLMRQANAARVSRSPPVLWDVHRPILSGAQGWVVTRAEIFEIPDGPFVTTIAPNQAVLIDGTHRDRLDREWLHIVSRRARGWMRADTVAHVRGREERLGPQTEWLTVIAPEVRLGSTFTADMGTRLRYATPGGIVSRARVTSTHFHVSAAPRGAPAVRIPIRRPDGMLGWETHRIAADTIGRDLARATFYPGTVPPSRENTLRLAWRFLGQPWALGRTDCSGILAQIADAMGLTMVARHSGDQMRQGRRLWSSVAQLGTGTNSESVPVPDSLPHALARLGTDVLLLGTSGHMALYLGARDGAHWIFHAVEGYGVIVSPLSFKQLDTRFTTAFTLQGPRM